MYISWQGPQGTRLQLELNSFETLKIVQDNNYCLVPKKEQYILSFHFVLSIWSFLETDS